MDYLPQELQLQELQKENDRLRDFVEGLKKDEFRSLGSMLLTVLRCKGRQAAVEEAVKRLKDKTLDEIREMSLELPQEVKELIAETVVELILPDLRE